jgi:hypothetical protein
MYFIIFSLVVLGCICDLTDWTAGRGLFAPYSRLASLKIDKGQAEASGD